MNPRGLQGLDDTKPLLQSVLLSEAEVAALQANAVHIPPFSTEDLREMAPTFSMFRVVVPKWCKACAARRSIPWTVPKKDFVVTQQLVAEFCVAHDLSLMRSEDGPMVPTVAEITDAALTVAKALRAARSLSNVLRRCAEKIRVLQAALRRYIARRARNLAAVQQEWLQYLEVQKLKILDKFGMKPSLRDIVRGRVVVLDEQEMQFLTHLKSVDPKSRHAILTHFYGAAWKDYHKRCTAWRKQWGKLVAALKRKSVDMYGTAIFATEMMHRCNIAEYPLFEFKPDVRELQAMLEKRLAAQDAENRARANQAREEQLRSKVDFYLSKSSVMAVPSSPLKPVAINDDDEVIILPRRAAAQLLPRAAAPSPRVFDDSPLSSSGLSNGSSWMQGCLRKSEAVREAQERLRSTSPPQRDPPNPFVSEADRLEFEMKERRLAMDRSLFHSLQPQKVRPNDVRATIRAVREFEALQRCPIDEISPTRRQLGMALLAITTPMSGRTSPTVSPATSRGRSSQSLHRPQPPKQMHTPRTPATARFKTKPSFLGCGNPLAFMTERYLFPD